MGKKILTYFFVLFLFCSTSFAIPSEILTLGERFARAQAGDFIVTAQESNYSLLFIRSITTDILLLEEVSVPTHQVDVKKIHWKEWMSHKAPGHTSWTLYEIDRKSNKLVECFSFSKNGWLFLDEAEQCLTRLFSLPLDLVPSNDRKKIGPQPASDEEDRRALWNPPLIVEGKKMAKPSFEVLKTQWPDDGSRLGCCDIELYFVEDFPFPYWLEIQSPHYAYKMRTIDSGRNLFSPIGGLMPHRAPHILSQAQKGTDLWKLFIKTPSYFQKLQLFVIDLTGESKATIPIPFHIQNGSNQEELILEMAAEDLNKVLQNQHRYRWVLIPEASSEIYIESEEVFTWNSTLAIGGS
jgi:hypothetical protein